MYYLKSLQWWRNIFAEKILSTDNVTYTIERNKTCQGEKPVANLETALKLCDFSDCEGIHDKDCNGENILLCKKVLNITDDDSKSNGCTYVKKGIMFEK